jgi:hypothetical protein
MLRQIKKNIVNRDRNIQHTIKQRKADWIGYILLRNCLLKHITAERMGGKRRNKM